MPADALTGDRVAPVRLAVVEETVEAVIRHRLADALGGWRGSLETALPTLAFVLWWLLREDLRGAVIASGVLVVVLFLLRLVTGGTQRYVGSALFATALAAFFALRSGNAEDAFLPGILMSAAWLVVSLASILARWPLMGFLVSIGDPDFEENPLGWRRSRAMVRACSHLTWPLVALYALRVAVMLPLYLQEQVAALGIAKVVMGWPLYLVAVAAMVWILVRGRTPVDAEVGAGA
ncbi:Protein of unknown function [Kytococcus aerolatus]|uniref:Intracellular septation protein A n=1 Tax=Kytococcus aerolatus TaxID=592308 RepID=A0A212T431_9MICO|nr:DUF3159 domain-containing protein [Kytococcus aerolatus]SNC60534.1 Protein of unknown function [Kytococcus aerolatus]